MSNTDFVFLYKNEEQKACEHWFGLQRFWFRSVAKYTPWVHRIYFVTAGHVPAWLNTSHEKIQVVRYEEFMPKGCCPTENINGVSLNLHRIEGIMEQFVVFSGLSFFTKKMRESKLFRGGIPLDSAILEIPCATYGKDIEPHVMLNNAGIINAHFDKKETMRRHKRYFFSKKYGIDGRINKQLKELDAFPGFGVFPIPYCMQKSVYERVWHEEGRLLEACSKQPKPTKRDFDLHLMRAWNICEGRFRPMRTKDFCCAELGNDDIDAIAKVIRRRKFRVIGLADATLEEEYDEVKTKLMEAFLKIFPKPCEFEIEPTNSPSENKCSENVENGEEFEDDDDDFYELSNIIQEDMDTKERAELIEKMRAGNRRKRRRKKKQ